jgi:transitional endoplasmic reticulum ATPase
MSESVEIRLKIAEALSKDVGRAFARMDPADMTRLGVVIGDILEVEGKRCAVCKVLPAFKEHRGQGRVQLDGISRDNAGAGLDEHVTLRVTDHAPAERITLAPTTIVPTERDLPYIGSLLDGLPVREGDRVRVTLFGSRSTDFRVVGTAPRGTVIINPTTQLTISGPKGQKSGAGQAAVANPLAYEDIGGLKPQMQRIREMIELPLRYPELFERLGIDAPKGVLIYGPPGCGKTMIARTIAAEAEANFFSVSGPEVIHKFYGESEAHLRKIFQEAAAKGPSIIFLDEIDAIAPKREGTLGEVEKRVVAQLLALMDGLNRRQNVIVIAATNLPNMIDPALRRPGRFDREIEIPIPDRDGRLEILEIHSRGMPLNADVDMKHLADVTHGFVGADLQGLCREAAMICLRRLMPELDLSLETVPYERLAQLEICMDDFQEALHDVEPSAIREVFIEISNVKWDDVGGLHETKQRLREAVSWPLKYPQLYQQAGVRPPKGILLDGPPGCGKTLLAKAVAYETQVNVISVKGPALMSKYVGESERGVREIFHKARQAAPCIMFFDEIDALVPARGGSGSDNPVGERVLSQFLAEMDGIEDLRGVLVLGATNRADILDPAILRPGRFDEVVRIPLPDDEGRHEIFKVHLRGKPVEPNIDLDRLVRESQGFSGAEVAAVCSRAALAALRREVAKLNVDDPDTSKVQVTVVMGDLMAAIAEIRAR